MMTNVASKGLLAAFAASALALIGAFLLVGTASAANTVSLTPSAATIAPGAEVTISVDVAADTGVTVGGIVADITYDESAFTVKDGSCKPAATCNPAFAAGTIRITKTDLDGLGAGAGQVTLVAAANASGAQTIGLTVADCKNELAATITCAASGTTVTVATATATPSPTAAATTPAVLPSTGGLPTDGSSSGASSMLTWLLVAAGLVVVSGGAWAVSRARREI